MSDGVSSTIKIPLCKRPAHKAGMVGFAVAEQVTQERHDSEDLRKVRIYERYTCEDGRDLRIARLFHHRNKHKKFETVGS